MKHRIFAKVIQGLIFGGIASTSILMTAAFAGGPLVTVYEHINGGGKSQSYYQIDYYRTTTGTLGIANDSISSIVVNQPVIVSLCSDDPCQSNSNQYRYFPKGSYNLTDYDFNDVVSALFINPDLGAVLLFEHINEQGSHITATRSNPNQPDLRSVGFNDTISSVYVPYGFIITLYQDINYGGDWLTLYPGVYNLTRYYLRGTTTTWNDQVSSYKLAMY